MNDCEIIDPRFRPLVLANAALEKLAEGFRWLEGPVWFADQQCLLFSDIPNDRILRWTASGGVSVFREPSRFANGHTRDRGGRLVGCLHGGRSVVRTELDGCITTLVDRCRGKRLNSPNDVVVKSDGTIWFSDPPYGIQTDYEGGKRESELPANLYRFDPRDASLTVLADDIVQPNGLCFSPDEKRLYVTETGLQFDPATHRGILVYDIAGDGHTLCNRCAFYQATPGNADGIRCDESGNLWASAGDGVHCIAPDGTLLGKIHTPCPVSNLCFGDRHYSRLFLCASQTLYAIWVNSRGAQRP
ncbi:MAG: SMP-30/gluconolactonase/LRE family protein [Nevskiaceae bacterium]|nr:MAG: SMP-30/gluconolactonase/LRE family protein [Nevskiaceae bacterium]TBR73887.1 MAG: SMP-30/gluconolactonase/LRE family protein [Nevskiaceae bacterium]